MGIGKVLQKDIIIGCGCCSVCHVGESSGALRFLPIPPDDVFKKTAQLIERRLFCCGESFLHPSFNLAIECWKFEMSTLAEGGTASQSPHKTRLLKNNFHPSQIKSRRWIMK